MSDIITNYKITDRPPSPDDYLQKLKEKEKSELEKLIDEMDKE